MGDTEGREMCSCCEALDLGFPAYRITSLHCCCEATCLCFSIAADLNIDGYQLKAVNSTQGLGRSDLGDQPLKLILTQPLPVLSHPHSAARHQPSSEPSSPERQGSRQSSFPMEKPLCLISFPNQRLTFRLLSPNRIMSHG